VTKKTGSGSDEWIYWRSFTSKLNSDSLQSLSTTRSIPLLDHEHLSLYYEEQRIPAHAFNCLERRLSLESTLIHFWFLNSDFWLPTLSLNLGLMLRPTFSRPVCLRMKRPFGAYDRNFITVRQLRVCWCGALSLTRRRVCVYNCCWPSPAQSFLVLVPWDSRPYFAALDSRLQCVLICSDLPS
jgi:hypothetical protein